MKIKTLIVTALFAIIPTAAFADTSKSVSDCTALYNAAAEDQATGDEAAAVYRACDKAGDEVTANFPNELEAAFKLYAKAVVAAYNIEQSQATACSAAVKVVHVAQNIVGNPGFANSDIAQIATAYIDEFKQACSTKT